MTSGDDYQSYMARRWAAAGFTPAIPPEESGWENWDGEIVTDGYVRPLDADPAPSELGRELHANGVHTECPAQCLTIWDSQGDDR